MSDLTNKTSQNRKTDIYLLLAAVFITNAVLAELIGSKIFSFEKTLDMAPFGLSLFGGQALNLDLSAGVVIWPVVFIISDVINEYFGRKGLLKISLIAVGMILYVFATVYGVTLLAPADFWLEVNKTDALGNPFDINYAFSALYRQSMNIIFASVTAFMVGQLIDAYVFSYLRRLTGHRKLWLRATASTVLSQFVDSFLILFVAFYLLGNWSVGQVIAVGLVQYSYKILLSILLIPLLNLLHRLIDNYLGIVHSEKA